MNFKGTDKVRPWKESLPYGARPGNVFRERNPLDEAVVPQSFTYLPRTALTAQELALCTTRLPTGVQPCPDDVFCLLKHRLCHSDYYSGILMYPGEFRSRSEAFLNTMASHRGPLSKRSMISLPCVSVQPILFA